jgi:hypothetical protein
MAGPEINHLLTLQAVRSTAHLVLDLANRNALNHFDYHPERLDETVEYVTGIIQVCRQKSLSDSSPEFT